MSERLRWALAFIADWAHDCSPSNRACQPGDEIDPRYYGFDDIEARARAALAEPEPELDVERLAKVLAAVQGPWSEPWNLTDSSLMPAIVREWDREADR